MKGWETELTPLKASDLGEGRKIGARIYQSHSRLV